MMKGYESFETSAAQMQPAAITADHSRAASQGRGAGMDKPPRLRLRLEIKEKGGLILSCIRAAQQRRRDHGDINNKKGGGACIEVPLPLCQPDFALTW